MSQYIIEKKNKEKRKFLIEFIIREKKLFYHFQCK